MTEMAHAPLRKNAVIVSQRKHLISGGERIETATFLGTANLTLSQPGLPEVPKDA